GWSYPRIRCVDDQLTLFTTRQNCRYKRPRPGAFGPGFFMGGIRDMRKIALLTFGALVAAGFATAALADTMSETYGNTVLATNDKGETTKLWFKADGTFSGEDSK